MSTTPPEGGAEIPAGYRPGDYLPFKDRDPENGSAIAGQWSDPALRVQLAGHHSSRKMTAEEQYRAIYGYDAPVRVPYASWGRRALGYLVDAFLGLAAAIPLIVGYLMLIGDLGVETDSTGRAQVGTSSDVGTGTIALLVVGGLVALAFNVYNSIIRQGRTGYSLGKTVVGIRLLKESTGEPMGPALCLVRQLAHYVDSLLCYLGWFWPLWDRKRQTFADKIMRTVVVIEPQESGR